MLSVPATDRAFLYGDGLFETLLIVSGRVLWLDLHIDRLADGARRLRMNLDSRDVRDAISDTLGTMTGANAILRVTVSRGSGQRGYAPDLSARARVTTTHHSLERPPLDALPPATVTTSSVVMSHQPLLAGLKHCNRLEQVMAAAEAKDLAVDDVLLRNERGVYQCSSNANLFVLRGDRLLTSPCDGSGVLGTRRRFLMETLAPKLGMTAEEKPLQARDLREADGLFLSNSVVGVRGISRWDEQDYPPSERLSALQQSFFSEARQCCAI
ncbi:aminodeoxychorismate lyase apoprotein [Congregibacter litoralis KT71]|uniref:Aminodeoxychorismate lyase n=1 Tax=Congregibacter litoralis KT71 TaxID=314285 RepID=A4A8F3_9GAMM|nr:aminodeoxychorismate lyase apoprotein [Congregibacter litoralis KT71]